MQGMESACVIIVELNSTADRIVHLKYPLKSIENSMAVSTHSSAKIY